MTSLDTIRIRIETLKSVVRSIEARRDRDASEMKIALLDHIDEQIARLERHQKRAAKLRKRNGESWRSFL